MILKISATKTVHSMQPFSIPEPQYRLGLEIAGISISLGSFLPWEEEPAFVPFVNESASPDFQVVFHRTDMLPEIPAAVIHEDECYRVHPDGRKGYLRSFFDAPRDYTPYAVAEYDHESGRVWIECLPKGNRCVSQLHNSFFHIGFEAMLISRQRLCFHAACVDTAFGGILFSGPSGIGKSTQANLWCAYRRAKQINGDRPILSKEGAGWRAWGSPYAGSSGCHVNDSCRIGAIVVLQQGRECTIHRLNPSEAFRAVWSVLTVHSWDKGFVEKAFDLTENLIRNVPVYRLTCTPDENAVVCLEEELGKEFTYGRNEDWKTGADGIPVYQGQPAEDSAERNL